MRYARGGALIAAALLAGAASAHGDGLRPAGDTGREEFTLPRSAAPKIDGDLSDPAWKSAQKAETFVRFAGSSPVVERTEAWMVTDGKSLFVAFHCHDSQPQAIRASETQRGSEAVWSDDSVSVFVDSQNTHRNYSTFSLNSINTQKEEIEGGTADNLSWAGRWHSAARRVDDGWVCELAIPFQLLRYPPGARRFGIGLMRRVARETNPMIWPAMPEAGRNWQQMARFLPDAVGVDLPRVAARPVVLPYALSTAGDGLRARQGLDVKYPISTTLTGLLAVNPDFQTIENDVARINFSYNEQFVEDRRPFFAEGGYLFPDPDMFYSRRIEDFDAGLKVVGRAGNQSLAFLTTNANGRTDGRSSMAMRVEQGIGDLSRVGFAAVGDNQNGVEDNRVARVFGEWGKQLGRRRASLMGRFATSWQAGSRQGDAADLYARYGGVPGRPELRASYSTLDADFISNLGLLQDRDRRSYQLRVSQQNQFDRGPVEFYYVSIQDTRADRQSGAFFFDNLNTSFLVQNRRGLGVNFGTIDQRRIQSAESGRFRDRVRHTSLLWNQRSLFGRGGIGYDHGRQQGMAYRFIEAQQGVLISRPFSVQGSYGLQKLGDVTTRQTVVTGTYRLDPFRTLSCRLISQNGTGNVENVGAQIGTNVYLGYAQRVRSGTDIFVLLGDPNAARTRGQVTVKLVRPL